MGTAQAEPQRELYDKLRWHVGHQIAIAGYGPIEQVDPQELVVECETCHQILLSVKRKEKGV